MYRGGSGMGFRGGQCMFAGVWGDCLDKVSVEGSVLGDLNAFMR